MLHRVGNSGNSWFWRVNCINYQIWKFKLHQLLYIENQLLHYQCIDSGTVLKQTLITRLKKAYKAEYQGVNIKISRNLNPKLINQRYYQKIWVFIKPLHYQLNQLVLSSNCINYQPANPKPHHQLRETNGSTDSGPVSWCTITNPEHAFKSSYFLRTLNN